MCKSASPEARLLSRTKETAKVALEEIKPKVFSFENAPEFFMKDGKDLVDKLREIGKEHGYSFSLVKTNAELHGT